MIQIISDSGSDFLEAEAETCKIKVLPLKVNFGGTEYLDGKTITQDAFYEKLIETDILPTTSQVPPAEFADSFREEAEKGSEVICITISQKLSGCYQSANIAREEVMEDYPDAVICVVDSENACLGQRVLVELAVRMRDEGRDTAYIVAKLEEMKKKVRLVALIDTLEYLVKGGRLSKGAGFMGEMLSIKPVIAVENGEVVVLGKARGSKNANNKLTEMVDRSGGIDFEMPYLLAYSGLSRSVLDKYIADSEYLFKDRISPEDLPVACIGATIGTHVGPGAIGVAFFARD